MNCFVLFCFPQSQAPNPKTCNVHGLLGRSPCGARGVKPLQLVLTRRSSLLHAAFSALPALIPDMKP